MNASADAVLDAIVHLCAAAALGYAARSATLADGWESVPAVERLDDAPSLSIVVPARNEERSIERCVRSLLAQTLDDFEVIVVDDRSDDRTPQLLTALARAHPRLRVVQGAPLPHGWVGKPWALAQGARIARGAWLLFTDADTVHAPHASASALAFARARRADAISLNTYQELGTWAERAILPTILGFIVFVVGPIERINDHAAPDDALANGQYVLVSRAAFDALGGYEPLRGEIVEDVAFARLLKRDGRFRLYLADGEALVRVRMYRSLRELWHGFTKNMYAGAGGDASKIAGGATLLALLSAVPAALALDAALRGRALRALKALLVLGCGVAVTQRALRRTLLPVSLAWYAPVGYAFCAAIALNSAARVLSGRGVAWRGRRYSGRAGEGARSA
jgi:chlorobactene glucosyltransferase